MRAKKIEDIPEDWINDRITSWWECIQNDEDYIDDLFWEAHTEHQILQEYNDEIEEEQEIDILEGEKK